MRNQIDYMIKPNIIAVCGSTTPGKLGYVLIDRLVSGGFSGTIYAINPKGLGAMGVDGFTSMLELKTAPDMVLIASPSSTVVSVLEDAGKAGVKTAVIISSGFSEAGNSALEDQVKIVANKYGIRYIGPNCAGLINMNINMIASLEAAPKVGRAALISQSGAVGGLINAMSNRFNIGLSKFLSYGNGSDLKESELLTYLTDDPETNVIAMYMENVKDGSTFIRALSDATAKKPVVIIKSGRTESGTRAAMSHTGAMAGSDAVYDAVFEKYGAIRANSIEDMFDYIACFSDFKKIDGRKIAIITNSGGPGVLTVDQCDKLGLSPAPLSDAVKNSVKATLPAYAGLSNPIDVTVEGSPAQYECAINAALSEFDAAVVIYVGTPYLLAKPYAEAVVNAKNTSGKPILTCFAVGSDIDDAINYLHENGVPNYISGERAANALEKLALYSEKKHPVYIVNTIAEKHIEFNKGVIIEPIAMQLLDNNGISVQKFRFVSEKDALSIACEELGYPVCMKVVSPDIVHKSEVGGVILNIKTQNEADAAFKKLELMAIGVKFCGVIIYRMQKFDAEVIMGFTRDPRFGAVVAFGMGGVYTEIYKDIALRLAPLSLDEAYEMIKSVKAYKILSGARGKKSLDIAAIAENLVAFSKIPLVYPQIREADINPVFVMESGVVSGDVRLLGE
ncbi:MAG: acetate--CoA ligase family protein [Clostridia bacterium]